MKTSALFLFLLLSLLSVQSQTGPWAKYDAKMKGEALIRESDGGYVKEMQSIIDGGGDVNFKLQSGATALMVAAAGGRVDAVKLLLKAGADSKLKDANGLTALDRATMAGATEIVKLLSGSSTLTPPVKQEPVPVPTPAPSNTPIIADPLPVKPDTAIVRSIRTKSKWAAFGTYKVGEEVSFFNGSWNKGKVKEVGSIGDYKSKGVKPGERKYLIAREGAPNWNDWTDWGRVTGLSRDDFWTNYFIGDWKLGEVMGMTTRTEGGYQRDEYSFHAATEALQVMVNNTYRWKTLGGKIITGKWKAAADGAGIVLIKGFQGLDWTFRNETNAAEENIRGVETARLTTAGKMSIKGLRPM